jgi:hypothetical protein
MITTVVIIVLATVAAFVCFRTARGPSPDISVGTDISEYLKPVYLPGLLNLLDESQQQYLRVRLSATDFKSIRRQRAHVLLVYVRRIAHNAAVVIRWAELARAGSSDPDVQHKAAALVSDAIRTRVYALLAIAVLYLGLFVPHLTSYLQAIASRYGSLTEEQRSLDSAPWLRSLSRG